jgi:hypothetical protein
MPHTRIVASFSRRASRRSLECGSVLGSEEIITWRYRRYLETGADRMGKALRRIPPTPGSIRHYEIAYLCPRESQFAATVASSIAFAKLHLPSLSIHSPLSRLSRPTEDDPLQHNQTSRPHSPLHQFSAGLPRSLQVRWEREPDRLKPVIRTFGLRSPMQLI